MSTSLDTISALEKRTDRRTVLVHSMLTRDNKIQLVQVYIRNITNKTTQRLHKFNVTPLKDTM